MKYGIIGAGAIGGYYGGLLARYGLDVHFLLHSDYLHVKKNGLVVESKNGNFVITEVMAYSRPEDMPLCDVAVIALKSTQNFQLSAILPLMLKTNGIVILLQNGIDIEKDIAAIMPDADIISGLCHVASNKIGPGHIRHMYHGLIALGEYLPGYNPAGITKNLKMISNEFKSAGIPVELSGNIGEIRWRKLVWNIPFNGLSVVLNSTTDKLMRHSAARRLIEDIMVEVIAGANKCGFFIEKKYANFMMKHSEHMDDYKTSMMLDFISGRQLEIDAIYWRAIAMAEKHGLLMPTVKALALQLEFLNKRKE